eukprot:757547-Hanusia_phi.AAC.1
MVELLQKYTAVVPANKLGPVSPCRSNEDRGRIRKEGQQVKSQLYKSKSWIEVENARMGASFFTSLS